MKKMNKSMMGGLCLLILFVGSSSANLAISENQIVSGQPVTINAECKVGTTCTISRDGFVIASLVGDSYGTIHYVDYPPLGEHTYGWQGEIYGFSGTLVDHSYVNVVPNDAETLGLHSYADIVSTIASGDSLIRSDLISGILVPAHSLYADEAGNSDTVDGWHKSNIQNYVNFQVGIERIQRIFGDNFLNMKINTETSRAIARENQIEGDSIARDDALGARIDTETADRIAGDAAIWYGINGLDNRITAIENDITEIKGVIYTTNPTHKYNEYVGFYYKPFPENSFQESQINAPVSKFDITQDALNGIVAGKESGLTVENCIVIPKEIKDARDEFGRELIGCVAEPTLDSELVKFQFGVITRIGDNPDHYIQVEKKQNERTKFWRVDKGEFAGIILEIAIQNTDLKSTFNSCKRVLGGNRVECN